MKESTKVSTKKITTTAMLCAIAFAAMLLGHLVPPVMGILQYDPKDIVIALGGFIYGPITAVIISVIVSLIEMLTISHTGVIGLVMNVVSTCSFVCVAAFIYRRNHSIKGAIIGLISGVLAMTIVMLLWNYILTPIYMHYPRKAVVDLILPLFLPFNLLKGGINAAATVIIYKPVVSVLRRAKLIPPSKAEGNTRHSAIPYVIGAAVLLVICIVLFLVLIDVIKF